MHSSEKKRSFSQTSGSRAPLRRARVRRVRHRRTPPRSLADRHPARADLHRSGDDGLAVLAQPRQRLRALGLRARRLALGPVVETLLADVRHHAEPQVVAGIVEDQEPILARRPWKAPADRLDEEHPALGRLLRPRCNAHRDRCRSSGRQRCRSRGLAGSEAVERGLPVLARCLAVHVFAGTNTDPAEPLTVQWRARKTRATGL